MTYSMSGIQAGLRDHYHQGECDERGNCGAGQNQRLAEAGEGLVQAGGQLAQLGQQLMEQGDFRQGMQVTREGLNLEQQGLQLEQQSQQGNDPSMSPYGSTGDNSWNHDNSQYGWPGQNYGDGENYYSGNDGGLSGSGNCGCGSNQLAVNGNSVDTGRYTITASTDGGGTLEVKDKTNGESFKVWGDPHITTDKGDTTSFQQAPATFKLPDGTEITVDPTQVNSSGVAYINNVTITKGNNAVTMTGFQGNLQTQALPGEGRYLDQATPDGTVLTAENGQIDQLMLPDGTEINGNNVKNIDGYANENNAPGQTGGNIAQLQQEIAGLEQEISQIELGMTSLTTTANLLQNDRF
jgi:hypothetical protein